MPKCDAIASIERQPPNLLNSSQCGDAIGAMRAVTAESSGRGGTWCAVPRVARCPRHPSRSATASRAARGRSSNDAGGADGGASSSYVVPDPRRVKERHGKRLYYHGHGEMLLREDLISALMEVDASTQVKEAGSVSLTREQVKIMEAFWIGVGVRKKAHRERLIDMACKAGLYRDPVRLLERLAQLEDALWLGASLSGVDLGVIVGRCPRVIYCDLDWTAEKLELLRELLPTVDLKRLIERNPQVLGMDFTMTIPAKLRELSKLLPYTDVFALIDSHPKLLSMNISSSVSSNLRAMRQTLASEGVSESTVEAMIMYSPRLLTTNPNTFADRCAQLARTKPGAIQQYALKPASLARMLTSSERVISRLAFLHERHPHDTTSAIVAVNTSAAKFIERFPDFEEWSQKM